MSFSSRRYLVVLFLLLPVLAPAEQDPATGSGSRPGAYLQEVGRQIKRVRGLDRFEVLSLGVGSGGRLIVGTSEGLLAGPENDLGRVEGAPHLPVSALGVHGEDVLFVAGDNLWRWRPGALPAQLAKLPEALRVPGRVHGLLAGELVLLSTFSGLLALRGSDLVLEETLSAQLGLDGDVRGASVGPGGEVAVAARAGLFIRDGSTWRELHPSDGRRSWAVRDARGVAHDAAGRLWFVSPQGVGCRLGGTWELLEGRDGLPFADFTALKAHPDGSVWMGTTRGAIRFDGAVWAHRQGPRWLPADHIAALAISPTGAVLLGTAAGIGTLERVPYTLARKAQELEDAIDLRHRRTPFGYVNEVSLEDPEDLGRWRQLDSDNDGLWTSMYGAGECFAHAATKDPRARRRARQAFWALRFLGTVTQGGEHPAPPGFVARTIVPTSGPDPNVGRVQQDREEQATGDKLWKVIDPRWPRSADGKWYWKSDTSSDELDGHYFFYALYHDLVATSELERAEVRKVVAGITDHLLAHDYNLVDHDGQPTRWAHFSPQELNFDPNWWEERGLNSLSMLSYLKVAEHLTGSARYADAARELIERHGYAQNLLVPKIHVGPGSGNHSDDEMAFMGFYNLVRLEKDPRLKAHYAFAFRRAWQLELPELNPLFNFLYAAVGTGLVHTDAWGSTDLTPPGGKWLEESLDTLRRFPLDRRNWSLVNSFRLDLVPMEDFTGRRGGRAAGRRRDGRVLPIDERHVNHWNMDPYELDQHGDGRELADGASFLLPYYLGLHLGLLPSGQEIQPPAAGPRPTLLGRAGQHFTLNGEPRFLVGASYYSGLGASLETICRDLDDLESFGINWIRVWATWSAPGDDASAFTPLGEVRPAQLEKLRWLVGECDERGLVVDVTLSRGGTGRGPSGLLTPEAHRRAVEAVIEALRGRRNWYLDLANERNIADARRVGAQELRALRERARELDPDLLVTASRGGDLALEDVRVDLVDIGLDFLSPHRNRESGSAGRTAMDARRLQAEATRLGHPVPVHYQEPFRRGYTDGWEPGEEDFLTDLRGALEGGAAGWCFHNGSTHGAPDARPGRSFDLSSIRLLEQLDPVELKTLSLLRAALSGAGR